MKKETWFLDNKSQLLLPEDLSADPDKFGGCGMHMMKAHRDGVISIPLTNKQGCCVSLNTTDADAAEMILMNEAITIHSDGYWADIHSPKIKVCFLDTEDLIPMWKGPIS